MGVSAVRLIPLIQSLCRVTPQKPLGFIPFRNLYQVAQAQDLYLKVGRVISAQMIGAIKWRHAFNQTSG